MPPENILDPQSLVDQRIVADRAAVQAILPQRFEMAMLDGILMLDGERHIVAGFKDVRADEFWTRGHFPGEPVFPGVLMCETAAQLCSYYIKSQKIVADDQIVGFGGMENVRFRSMVKPGDRLIVVARAERLNRRQSIFNVQGFIGSTMAFHADIIGIPLRLGAE